jgi:hypothetical protein
MNIFLASDALLTYRKNLMSSLANESKIMFFPSFWRLELELCTKWQMISTICFFVKCIVFFENWNIYVENWSIYILFAIIDSYLYFPIPYKAKNSCLQCPRFGITSKWAVVVLVLHAIIGRLDGPLILLLLYSFIQFSNKFMKRSDSSTKSMWGKLLFPFVFTLHISLL